MERLSMCRICLVENVRMYVVTNKSLQETYEKLADVPFVTGDSRPVLVCYLCCSKLKQCCRLQRQCRQAEQRLAHMLREDYEQKPLSNREPLGFAEGFAISPIENISIVEICQAECVSIKQEVCDEPCEVKPKVKPLNEGPELEKTTESYQNVKDSPAQQTAYLPQYNRDRAAASTKMSQKCRTYCAVYGCRSQKHENFSFFSLPRDEQRRRTWLEIIDRPDLLKPQTKAACHFVCSLHFDKHMIRYIPQLKPDAVPKKSVENQPSTFDHNMNKDCVNVSTQTIESFTYFLSAVPTMGLDEKSPCVQTSSENTSNNTTQTIQALSSETPRKRKHQDEYKQMEIKKECFTSILRRALSKQEIKKEVQSEEPEC